MPAFESFSLSPSKCFQLSKLSGMADESPPDALTGPVRRKPIVEVVRSFPADESREILFLRSSGQQNQRSLRT